MTSSGDTFPLILDPRRFEQSVGEVGGKLYLLRNSSGMLVAVTNYGAKIEQIIVPDRDDNLDDVALGYDSLDGAINGAFAIGAFAIGSFVGRYTGRSENARFSLSAKSYTLSANNGLHCLHGGVRGTPYRMFDATQTSDCSV